MKRAIQILAIVGIAALPAAIYQATAWADDEAAEAKREAAQRLAKDERVRIDRYATIVVYLNPHVTTTISTDKPIDFTIKPKWKELNYVRRLCHVTLQPSSLPPGETIGAMTLETTKSVLTVVLRAAKTPDQAHGHFRAEYDPLPAANNICAQRPAHTPMPQLALASFEGQSPGSTVLDIGDVLFNHETFEIEQPGTADNRGQTALYPTVWARFKNEWYLIFDFENGDRSNYPVGHVALTDEYNRANHARAVYVEDGRIDPNDKTLTTVPRGRRQQMAVLIDDPDGLGDYVTLAVTEPDGSRRIQRTKIPVWDLTPPPDENVGKITLSVKGVLGAVWLADGVGADRLEATMLRGIGIGATYGFTEYWNVQVDAIGANSRSANFGEIISDGELGDLERSVSLARFQVGGLLRWGQRYLPSIRLGAGLQIARHRSAFFGATSSQPKSSLEFTTYLSLSAGLDMRINDNVIAGITASIVEPRDREMLSRTIHAGFHLSYDWKSRKSRQ